jgi:L-lactate dehydrogenase
VRRAAYTIIEGKGATWYGIGAGLARLAAAIARDEGAVFSVAIATPEVEGVTDVALSIPRVIARAGVTADLFPELAPAEHAALRASAAMLKDLADAVPL